MYLIYCSHNSGTTHWHDPRTVPVNGDNNLYSGGPHSISTTDSDSDPDGPLPPGWERIDDPQYGVFYME
jgi:hypothetical protein